MDAGSWLLLSAAAALWYECGGAGTGASAAPTGQPDDLYANVSSVHSSAPQGTSTKLVRALMAQHDPAAPPDGILYVHYEIELVRILEVNELAQTLSALLYVKMTWTDPTLAWDPTDYHGVNETWLPHEKVWLPDIIVFNMISHSNLLSHVRGPVAVESSGKVIYTYPAIYQVMCTINVDRFPIDVQQCEFDISSWDYNIRKLRLEADNRYLLQHYQVAEEWSLNEASMHTTTYEHEGITVTEIIVKVEMERRPFFYMISLVFPSVCISMVVIVGLFSKHSSTGEREEKFTMGSTAILSMTVLALIVTEKVRGLDGGDRGALLEALVDGGAGGEVHDGLHGHPLHDRPRPHRHREGQGARWW